MTVGELIKKLQSYKQNVKVDVIAHNKSYNFTVCTGGGSDGGDNDYNEVSLYIDELCQSEKSK